MGWRSSDLGTLTWLQRTGGRLAWRDRLVFILQGLQATMASRQRSAAGIRMRNIEVERILPPDSAITREALAICQDASPPFLLHHCLRAYFWARLLDADGRPFDDEAVFTALLLHDVGLCDGPVGALQPGECFTGAGVRAATALARRHGWSDHRSVLAAEAIALHLNVSLGSAHAKEARMVRAGSGADVAGLGLDVLAADQIAEVVVRYPRLAFKNRMVCLLKEASCRQPDGRLAFMMDHLGFERLIRNTCAFEQ